MRNVFKNTNKSIEIYLVWYATICFTRKLIQANNKWHFMVLEGTIVTGTRYYWPLYWRAIWGNGYPGRKSWFKGNWVKVASQPYTLSYGDIRYTKMFLSSSPIERCHWFLDRSASSLAIASGRGSLVASFWKFWFTWISRLIWAVGWCMVHENNE